jgi:transmembrane sensor
MQRRSHSELPPGAARAWQEWSRDPENLAAYKALDRFLAVASTFPMPPLPSRAELLADTESDRLVENEAPDAPVLLEDLLRPTPVMRRTRLWRHVRIPVGCAAALAAAAAVLWANPSLYHSLRQLFDATELYATAPGELRTVRLEDQSFVTMAGSTRLQVRYSADRRRIVLESGEALFNVRHDPKVPFEVKVSSSLITALGTTFDVHRYPSNVEVTVTEGAVKVSVDPSASSGHFSGSHDSQGSALPSPPMEVQTVTVWAGHQAQYGETGEIDVVRASVLDEVTSWLHGRRLYKDKPLVKVIQDLQLYVPRRIELDPDMSTLRFTGSFDKLDSAQVNQWVLGLPNIYPIEIDATDSRVLRIRCRSPGCANTPP